MGDKIGEVTHYFGDLSVCVIALADDLQINDEISFVRGGEELFTQRVESMEVDETQIESASAGDEVAVKVSQKAREGTEVYR